MRKNVSILIVDDEPVVIKSCERVLKEEGYDVQSAMSGYEAIELMERNAYDLVFVDIKMPEMDGITLIEWIRKSKPDMEIGVITGYPSKETFEEAVKLGCFEYMPKPFTPVMLIDATQRALKLLKERLLEEMPPGDSLPPMATEIESLIEESEIYGPKETPAPLLPVQKEIEGRFQVWGGDFTNAGVSFKDLRAHLGELGVQVKTIRRAAVSMFEAEINLIIHAIAGTIHYRITGDELNITVSDVGPGIEDLELAMQDGYSTAPEWARELGWGSGMGLPNIKNSSDKFRINSVVGQGTTLEILIRLRD